MYFIFYSTKCAVVRKLRNGEYSSHVLVKCRCLSPILESQHSHNCLNTKWTNSFISDQICLIENTKNIGKWVRNREKLEYLEMLAMTWMEVAVNELDLCGHM